MEDMMSFTCKLKYGTYTNCWVEARTLTRNDVDKQFKVYVIMTEQNGYPEPVAKINIVDDETVTYSYQVEEDLSLHQDVCAFDVLLIKAYGENTGIVKVLEKLGVIKSYFGDISVGRINSPLMWIDTAKLLSL